MKIIRYSALVAMSSILWTLGLTLCGALRTILLWEHSEIALLAAVSAVTTLSHEKVNWSLSLSLSLSLSPPTTFYLVSICVCQLNVHTSWHEMSMIVYLTFRAEEQFSWFLGFAPWYSLTTINQIHHLNIVSKLTLSITISTQPLLCIAIKIFMRSPMAWKSLTLAVLL